MGAYLLDVFQLRDDVVDGYADYVRSFLTIADPQIKGFVEERLDEGHLWPDALVQLNPAFQPGATIDELVAEGVLHPENARVFRRGKDDSADGRAAASAPASGGCRSRFPHRRFVRADHRNRLGQEPRLLRPDRERRTTHIQLRAASKPSSSIP